MYSAHGSNNTSALNTFPEKVVRAPEEAAIGVISFSAELQQCGVSKDMIATIAPKRCTELSVKRFGSTQQLFIYD